MADKPKEQWGTRVGVILAVAGSAVGLGNFLRFPGQAAQNGGGAFMIPYFMALVLIAIPMAWAEWTMGRYGGRFGFNSCPAIFGVLGRSKFWRFAGVLGLLIPIGVYMYYVYLEAWCLGYAWSYLTGEITEKLAAAGGGDIPKASGKFFSDFVGSDVDGLMAKPKQGGGIQTAVLFWFITFTLNFVLIYRGVAKGIEKFCIYAMPIMTICAFVVLARVLTLGTPDPEKPDQNLLNGLAFMWNPKAGPGEPWWFALKDPQVWLAACGQVFFSLSVGFGIIVNYASYLKKDDDVVLSGLTAASTNEFFEVCLGGLITLPAAFIFLGLAGASSGAAGGTFGLGFTTLPAVFMYMPDFAGLPIGRIIGFLWFFMLFLAAITSSLSMLQPAIAFLEEGLNIGRRASVAILGLICAIGSFFVIYYSKGLLFLDTIDFWVGTALIFVLAMIEVILFGWVFGVDKGFDEAHRGAEMRIPNIFKFIIKFVSPLFLGVIFIMWCINNLPGYVAQIMKGGVALGAVALIVTLIIFLTILVSIAGPRWQAETKDKSPRGVA
ncbi:MAG: sodium-dependent transporter [Phycisphaerae bacterium]